MKNLILITLLIFNLGLSQKTTINEQFSCTTKNIIPLRTFTDIPKDQCYYLKDTKNELNDYVGTWIANWDNKTTYFHITKKIEQYSWIDKYYSDYLIIKYKTIDINGNILFDNTNLQDEEAKIQGLSFRKIDNKYSLIYIDFDLCDTTGNIKINFADSSKTKLQWGYSQNYNIITNDCFFHNLPENQRPKPLPSNTILTKQ